MLVRELFNEEINSVDITVDAVYYEHPYDSPSGYITVEMSTGLIGRRLSLYFYQSGRILAHGRTHQIDQFWNDHKDEIKKFAIAGIESELKDIAHGLSKEEIIKAVLTLYKKDNHSGDRKSNTEYLILASRLTGRDYPEFKVIEKSMNSK